ncbi:MAG: cytochrome-c oxidase, cbb3-type subunit III [Paracoccaceae bacterium]
MTRKKQDSRPDPDTTGHVWDGIEEFNNPLPRWWLWTLYATIIWAVGYTILYPAWPLINGATQGYWGGSNRAAVAAEIDRYKLANEQINTKLAATPVGEVAQDPELAAYALNAGRAVFQTWCAQCHGSGAAGARGFPNLLDNDWLWGGSSEDIYTTIAHGIRNTTDPEARFSQMPAFGDLLEKAEIEAVVNHVLAISGQEHDASLDATGATIFADNCAVCHGAEGTGDRAQGAPDLTDAIWLYAGDAATLTETVTKARFGVMPAWTGRLEEAEIRAVAAYVHGLGGGE